MKKESSGFFQRKEHFIHCVLYGSCLACAFRSVSTCSHDIVRSFSCYVCCLASTASMSSGITVHCRQPADKFMLSPCREDGDSAAKERGIL